MQRRNAGGKRTHLQGSSVVPPWRRGAGGGGVTEEVTFDLGLDGCTR